MIEKSLKAIPLLVIGLTLISFCACNSGEKSANESSESESAHTNYTCPMHPQILQDKPGICPICKMDLVVKQNNTTVDSIHLSDRQIQLANIKTSLVGEGNLSIASVISGRLVEDPRGVRTIPSRMSGRIENLYVKEAGRRIAVGQPLFRIYSEELQVLQQDYLLQLKQIAAFPNEKIYRSLAEAAKSKLELYGFSASQVKSLAQKGIASPSLTVFSDASGIVREINVSEGQYIASGAALFSLVDLSKLWLEAEIYPGEVDKVRIGSPLKFSINGMPETHSIKVEYIDPAINPSTQRLLIRASVNNQSGKLQAGMQANVYLETENISKAFSVPLASVIRDEEGAYVWIKVNNNTFTIRKVLTGAEDANQIVLQSGLSDGEEIVYSGAYLLHSEYVLK